MAVKVEWTTAEQRALIYEQALGLLERMGMRFGTGRALDVLAGAGARVDVETGVARIPPDLVERALAALPELVVLGGMTPDDDCVLDGTIHFLNSGTPTHTVDFETGAYRATTADDLRKATVLLEAMPSVDITWPIVAATDVPSEQRILTEIAVTLSKTRKHVQHELEDMWQVEPILRLMEICGGDLEGQRSRPRLSLVCCTASPLMAHGPMLDACLAAAARGVPLAVLPMPVAGGNAPVTVAGTVTMNIAEFLGVATAVELACPGAPLILGAAPGTLDMRSTTFSFGALEGAQATAIGVEIGHDLGVPVIGPAIATDAKYAGIQAGFEKALRGLVVASSGADLMTGGIGLLAGAGVLSLPQIVIDDEIAQMIKRILGEVEISPETIMADMIERVGFSGDYLREKETRRRVRAGEHFMPTVASRLSYEVWEARGRSEYDIACEKVRQLLAEEEASEPLLSQDQARELDALVASAASLAAG